ncbi:hypothetical protein, partial [Escherichia coli]|uniref:hypothetical protein n=1 Tax=Escherichia coli TaxID=562 RepID=UPI0019D6EA56
QWMSRYEDASASWSARRNLSSSAVRQPLALDLCKLLTRLNDRLEFMLDRNHAIGHAVFMSIDDLPELRRRLAER